MSLHDLLGTLGVVLIVVTYAMLQLGRLHATDPRYSAANALGAALILVSLSQDFNLSAAVIEAFWLVISLIGLALWWRRRRGRH